MYFLELVLPLAAPTTYHYQIAPYQYSGDLSSLVGCRAVVPFGAKRFYTGIIIAVSTTAPEGIQPSKLKYILSLVDHNPLVPKAQIDLWRWLADYYCAPLGSVLRLAVPHGLLPESHTLIRLNSEFIATSKLSTLEEQILDTLAQADEGGLTLERLQSLIPERLSRAYYSLLALGAIATEEVLKTRYKPKLKAYLQLCEDYRTEEHLQEVFKTLARAKKRSEILTRFLALLEEQVLLLDGLIARNEFILNQPSVSAHIRKLIEQGILQEVFLADSRLQENKLELKEYLSAQEISTQPHELAKPVTLLRTHDIETREGQVIAWVRSIIASGGQVLLLSPSASGVPSAGAYHDSLAQAAQGKMYYYHPDVSELKRTELYQHLAKSDEPCLILGNRSAVFLPCRALRLIIIEDEQEYMYKHQYTSPLYHARDVALYLGNQMQIPIVLSSTNPSAETLFNALRGKYDLLNLGHETSLPSPTPLIEFIDLKQERRRREKGDNALISPRLRDCIKETLARGQRVLLIQNRRGYAPYVLCSDCATPLRCPHCAISLNYYSSRRTLACPHCTHTEPLPSVCPNCDATHSTAQQAQNTPFKFIGYGTERTLEEVNALFPDARTMRLDGETLQTPHRRRESLMHIEAGDVDIIIGTPVIKSQPIWDNIGLIAVVQLDDILAFPDFRAGERAYQFLYQMSLYAMRASTSISTRLALQTSEPQHPFISALKSFNYDQYLKSVLAERQKYNWPPFSRITYIVLKGHDLHSLERIAQMYAQVLQNTLGTERISGAQALSSMKIEGRYVRHIVCRRPYQVSFRTERQAFMQCLEWLKTHYPEAKRIQISFDVDPL